MDPATEEQMQYQGSGTIPALEEQEMMGEDDDYEDLYDGVNVGESFSLYHQGSEVPASSNMGNGGDNNPETQRDGNLSQDLGDSGIEDDVRYQNGGHTTVRAEITSSNHTGSINGVSENTVLQVPMSQKPANTNNNNNTSANTITTPNANASMNHTNTNANASMNHAYQNANANASMNQANPNAVANASMSHANVNDHIIRPMENGPTMLFVGELHWWTTDVDLENVLSQYGKVKEIKFFDERATGKSKGYCQVEFYDAAEAAACKEGMNGYMFNGRACVVTFASPQTLRQMGAGYANKNPQQSQPQPLNQTRRNVNEGTGRGGGGGSFPAGDGGRSNGRGGWRGGAPRGRGGFMGPRNNNLGNAGGMMGGPGFGGPNGGMMHPQAMMGPGPGFDPTYMGRGAGYGGFPGPGFQGMMPQFPGVNQMGAGMAPHVNPAFFGRGMAPNGMGMMGGAGMEPQMGGMWADPNMGGWTGEEHGQRTVDSSYGGDDGASDYGYGEGNPENSARNNVAPREKEKVPERDYSGTSERRYRDDREREQEQDWDKDRDRSDRDRSDRERKYRDEKDSYKDHRRKDRDLGYEDDYDRRQSSSRPRSRSRAVVEDERRTRPRNADYEKRRRAPSE